MLHYSERDRTTLPPSLFLLYRKSNTIKSSGGRGGGRALGTLIMPTLQVPTTRLSDPMRGLGASQREKRLSFVLAARGCISTRAL